MVRNCSKSVKKLPKLTQKCKKSGKLTQKYSKMPNLLQKSYSRQKAQDSCPSNTIQTSYKETVGTLQTLSRHPYNFIIPASIEVREIMISGCGMYRCLYFVLTTPNYGMYHRFLQSLCKNKSQA